MTTADATLVPTRNAATELRSFLESSRPSPMRSIRDFAESELVLPDGPYEGRRFCCDRQPFTALWFDAIDSGRWQRHVATGPTQSGKTWAAYIVPVLYHLFELQETVILGLPSLDMAADKWHEDIQPAIEASRYRRYLPTSGPGSRGGTPRRVRFNNDTTLRFMSGGGGDKVRAGFTARVVVITETDGMDEPGGRSREADKITQLEARTQAYGGRRRIYMECTVSTESGRTWREYSAGSRSRIALRCPKCRSWVTPGREQLVGWQDAADPIEASRRAAWSCPECAARWTERQRRDAVARSVLVHRDQAVAARGVVTGDAPPTRTLGFRWSACDNLFTTAGELGEKEWIAQQSGSDDLETELLQFWWALPVADGVTAIASLDARELAGRTGRTPRGVVPPGTVKITVGVDVGQHLLHWVAVAWRLGAGGTIIDYGRQEVPSREFGVERAVLTALRELRDTTLEAGWQEPDGPVRRPDEVLVDSGWKPDPVHRFVDECPDRYRASLGHGTTQRAASRYARPRQTSKLVARIGEGYHLSRLRRSGHPSRHVVEVDADRWKSWWQSRLQSSRSHPGAVLFYDTPEPAGHSAISRHFAAERPIEEWRPGRGRVTRWVQVSRTNHYLDAGYLAACAGHIAGVRLLERDATGQHDLGAGTSGSRSWFSARKKRRPR